MCISRLTLPIQSKISQISKEKDKTEDKRDISFNNLAKQLSFTNAFSESGLFHLCRENGMSPSG